MRAPGTLMIVGAFTLCGFSMSASASDPAGAASDPASADLQSGVWEKHEYSFQFLGFTTTYSCEGLANKLKVLLIAAGARADAKSTSSGCARGYGIPDKFAQANLTFFTLVPASDGKKTSAPINGSWRGVVFADRSPRELTLGDCELIEQFRSGVLPMFTTRNVTSQTACVPNQLSGSNINLKFEVLAPLHPRVSSQPP